MKQAANREKAVDGLLALDIAVIAACAAMSGENADIKKLRKVLETKANGNNK